MKCNSDAQLGAAALGAAVCAVFTEGGDMQAAAGAQQQHERSGQQSARLA